VKWEKKIEFKTMFTENPCQLPAPGIGETYSRATDAIIAHSHDRSSYLTVESETDTMLYLPLISALSIAVG
jgi:hypothetical protein